MVPVIPVIWEAEERGLQNRDQLQQLSMTLFQNMYIKKSGDMA